MTDDRSFPVSVITEAVLSYRAGCPSGKIRFLSDAFGIDAIAELVGTEPRHFDVTIEAKIVVKPNYISTDTDQWCDDSGDIHTVEQWLIDRFVEDNLADNIPGIDILTGYDVDVTEVTENGDPLGDDILIKAHTLDTADPTVNVDPAHVYGQTP